MQQDDTAEIIGTFKMMLTDPVGIFMNMTFLCKVATFIALVCLAIGAVMAILRRVNNSPRSGFLATLGIIGLVAGLLGTAYGGMVTYMTIQALHVTRLVVYLPSLIEAGVCLMTGVLAWLAAQIGNAGARRG